MKNHHQEISKKRKNSSQDSHQRTAARFSNFEEDENDMLSLSLTPYCSSRRPMSPDPPLLPPPPPLPMSSQTSFMQDLAIPNPSPHLQLSPSHPLYTQQSSSTPSMPLVYPQEPGTGPSSSRPFMQDLTSPNPSSHLQLSHSHPLYIQQSSSTPSMPLVYPQEPGTGPSSSRPLRGRRNPTQVPREGKSESVPAPFPWATTRRATVHNLDYLLSREIFTITGDVQCKRCERQFEMGYNLKEKFVEVGSYLVGSKIKMFDRAPSDWMNPVLPACKYCEQENSVKPIIAEKKKMINWLFLLLGQMLGCCTLAQLKYFCKHTKNHRTGAKDRVLYLTYLCLCKQLDPNGPFDR